MMLTRYTMNLIEVREIRVAHTRDDVVFGPGEKPLGGGTWLFSEPQPGLIGLVDLTRLGWEDVTRTDTALTISATCPIAVLRELPDSSLFTQCADSLLASWKIQHIATVGGNICTALPAGSMTSLAAALDATALVWCPDGTDRRMPVAALVTGVQRTALASGEVLRAVEIPITSLAARTAFRRISLSPLGRTGTLVIGRVDPSGEAVFTISGGTSVPHQLRFDELPSAAALTAAVDSIDDWYDDAHGKPDWRHAMSLRFAHEIREDL
jgi:hypothetical protein